MTATKSCLPRFERPPVIETVLGVFFRPVRGLNSIWQGVFWSEELQAEFPEFELRPPVEEVAERFDGDVGLFQAGMRWQVSDELETPRLWAKSATGEHILQVQQNALLANWLRRGEYREFADRLADFEQRIAQFGAFARRFSVDQPIVPVSCAVTYINHVPLDSGEEWASAAERVLTSWSNPPVDGHLPLIERGRFQFSFGFPTEQGRLHVIVAPAQQRETKNLVVQLELTGRITLTKERQSLDDARSSLITAHDWVVDAFAQLTRAEMHKVWGRIQ